MFWTQRLAGVAVLAAGVNGMTHAAASASSVSGSLKFGSEEFPLQYVQTWQEPGQDDELRIYLTHEQLSEADTKQEFRPHELAKEGKLHGICLVVNPRNPNLKQLSGKLLVQPAGPDSVVPQMAANSTKNIWQTLAISDHRIQGQVAESNKGNDFFGIPPYAFQVGFEAPVNGAGQDVQVLTGSNAQASPHASAYLAYEETMLKDGLMRALDRHATPDRVALITRQMKEQPGSEEMLGMFLEDQRANPPRGEARRKQVSKVVISGETARVYMETGEEEPLIRLGDRWLLN